MSTRKIVSLPAELAAAIDEYRFANRIKTESEAIRQLLELGLKAAAASAKTKAKRPPERE